MIDRLRKIEKGYSTIEHESKIFTEENNEKYIYSKYGGKKNFEKFIQSKNK